MAHMFACTSKKQAQAAKATADIAALTERLDEVERRRVADAEGVHELRLALANSTREGAAAASAAAALTEREHTESITVVQESIAVTGVRLAALEDRMNVTQMAAADAGASGEEAAAAANERLASVEEAAAAAIERLASVEEAAAAATERLALVEAARAAERIASVEAAAAHGPANEERIASLEALVEQLQQAVARLTLQLAAPPVVAGPPAPPAAVALAVGESENARRTPGGHDARRGGTMRAVVRLLEMRQRTKAPATGEGREGDAAAAAGAAPRNVSPSGDL